MRKFNFAVYNYFLSFSCCGTFSSFVLPILWDRSPVLGRHVQGHCSYTGKASSCRVRFTYPRSAETRNADHPNGKPLPVTHNAYELHIRYPLPKSPATRTFHCSISTSSSLCHDAHNRAVNVGRFLQCQKARILSPYYEISPRNEKSSAFETAVSDSTRNKCLAFLSSQ